jgi:hypothetical protein
MKSVICTIAILVCTIGFEALFDIDLTVAQRILIVVPLAVMVGMLMGEGDE